MYDFNDIIEFFEIFEAPVLKFNEFKGYDDCLSDYTDYHERNVDPFAMLIEHLN